MDEASLVEQCRKGDKKAFCYLVERYQKKLFSVAYGMLHQPDDAMDVVQEAFLKVHRHLPNFQGNSSFYTWMYRIVINLSIDFIRKEGRHQSTDYDDTNLQNQESPISDEALLPSRSGCNPVEALKNKELGAQIRKAIDNLSPNHRAVIVLRELEGMNYEEIADTLECSKGTVMSRLHHARSKLRVILEGYLKAGENIKKEPAPSEKGSKKQKEPVST